MEDCVGKRWLILAEGACSVNARAEMAKAAFLLNKETSKPTISGILQKTTNFNSEGPTDRSRVGVSHNKQGRSHRLGKAQLQWLKHCFQKHIAMNGPLITRKALTLQQSGNTQLASSEPCNLKFSDGCLHSLKKQ